MLLLRRPFFSIRTVQKTFQIGHFCRCSLVDIGRRAESIKCPQVLYLAAGVELLTWHVLPWSCAARI